MLSFLIFSLNMAVAESPLTLEPGQSSPSTQSELGKLFIGGGMGHSIEEPFLYMSTQFRPQIDSMVQPYADARIQMSMGPNESMRQNLASIIESGTEEDVHPADIDISWNNLNLQSHFGVEIQGPKTMFFRTGPSISYDNAPGMYEQLTTEYMIAVDLTSTLRVGGFVTAGADIELKDIQWTPTLTVAHVQGVNTGGGALRDTLSGLDLHASNSSMQTEFTHASYANHMSYIQVENHLRHGALSLHLALQAGKTHASDVTKYSIEEEGLEDPYNRDRLQILLGIGKVF